MADGVGDTKSAAAARRQKSRLQKRAPASIQIGPASSEWKVAIPLLSPLIQSPVPKEIVNPTAEIESRTKEAAVVVMKKWEHPAAPFCYEPAPTPFMPFVCTGISLDG